jgi:hypothetical protein
VDTTGGTVTGTFPVIAASQQSGSFATSFSGENYTLGYKAGTVSLTGPAAAATTKPLAKAPTVTSIRGGKRIAVVKLRCSKGTNCASYTVVASVKVTDKLHGKRQTVTETVAKRVGTITAGKSATLKLAINAAREAPLRKRSSIRARITVTVSGRVVRFKTVTIRG